MNEATLSDQVVQVEIGLDKLTKLFRLGVLCATEVRCLNGDSKERVWQLCLNTCLHRRYCSGAVAQTPALECGGELRVLRFTAQVAGREERRSGE